MKFNKATLYGSVVAKPKIIKDDDGEYQNGIFLLNVIRNERYTGDTNKNNNIRQDAIIIRSTDPENIKIMETFEKDDMVFLKGVLVTKSVMKGTFCTECNAEQKKEGMIVYVNPIFIERREHNLTHEESMNLLYQHKEISNEIFLVGHLCIDPIKVEALKKTDVTQYQISVTRTYHLDENKTDFPWVKSYGEKAKEDLKRLKCGSGVLIDGCLQSRIFPKKAVCCKCGNVYEWNDNAMDIVPYSVEYLTSYVTDEMLGIKKDFD